MGGHARGLIHRGMIRPRERNCQNVANVNEVIGVLPKKERIISEFS